MTDSEDNAPTHEPDSFYRTATEFKPMFTPDEPKEKTFGNDADGLRAAAKSLSEDREAGRVAKVADDAPITERNYHWDGGKGDAVPENYSLDARQAANDLARVREQEHLAAQPDTAAQVDAVRNAWNQSEQPQQQQPVQPLPDPQTQQQQLEQPQPQQPAHDGIDPEIAEALSRPKVKAALEETVAQVEQARAAFAQSTKEAAQISAAAVLSQWPDLARLSAQELPHALAAIAKVDPAQAAQIQGQLQRTQNLYNAHLQAEQAQQQVQAQRIEEYGRAEDKRFEQHIANETPETRRAVLENGKRILQEHYGVDATALAQAFKSSPALRSAEVQKMLFSLIKMHAAQENAATKLDRSVPPVQRPGVSVDRDAGDDSVNRAMAKFKSDPNAKSAAALLVARRAATRR